MGAVTWREALGGPWASHWVVWAALYPPTTLVVLLRESVTPYPHWWWPLLSATLQHLAVGVIITVGAAIFRRRHPILPLAVIGIVWGLAAVARGLIGGGIAQSVAGVDPEFAFRISAWLLASTLWVPVFVYTLAQFDQRRLLLGAQDATQAGLADARDHAGESADHIQHRLRESVRQTLEPVLADLQGSLARSRDSLSRERIDTLGAQLTAVHDEVVAVVESAGGGHRAAAGGELRASTRRAFDVTPQRPIVTSLMVTFATIALVVPDAWRVFGALAGAEVSVATTLAGLILASVPHLALRAGWTVSIFPGQRVTIVAIVLSVSAMTWIMLTSEIDPITWHGLLISPLIAVALILASTVFSLAAVLARSNGEASDALAAAIAELDAARATHDALEERERTRLSILLHGPIQGRLAACVMALNFYTAASDDGRDDDGHAAGVIDAVVRHLADVSVDLASLAELGHNPTRATPEEG